MDAAGTSTAPPEAAWLSVTYRPSVSDVARYYDVVIDELNQRTAAANVARPRSLRWSVIGLASVFVVAVALNVAWKLIGGQRSEFVRGALFGVFAGPGVLLLLGGWAFGIVSKRRRATGKTVDSISRQIEQGTIPFDRSERTLTLTPRGIGEQRENCNGFVHWRGVRRIVEHRGTYLVFFGAQEAFVVPKDAFSQASEGERFAALVTANLRRDEGASQAPPTVGLVNSTTS